MSSFIILNAYAYAAIILCGEKLFVSFQTQTSFTLQHHHFYSFITIGTSARMKTQRFQFVTLYA